MKTRQEYITILREHTSVLQERFGIRSMTLFGSVARGEHTEESDVDVLVDMPPVFYTACAANDYLEDLLGCKVDMIRKRPNLRQSFLKQINADGIAIFETT